MVSETDRRRLADNHRNLLERIAAAARRSPFQDGRMPQLVAVTKTATLDEVVELVKDGALRLGENRPQQLAARAERLAARLAELNPPSPAVEWHFIGHLQRNKIDLVRRWASLIHSVDSERLLMALEESGRRIPAKDAGPSPLPVLLQVNVSGEATKQGFTPAELRSAWPRMGGLRCVRIRGLMTMAPLVDDPEQARPHFAALRQLRNELQDRAPEGACLEELSMGMSHDFEAAVEEGATLVRVGSALFEGLTRGAPLSD